MSIKRIDLLILTIIFIASRALLRLAGIRFDATPLAWFYQFLDPLLLQHRLAESILYLHSQPPGFNAFLGCVLMIGRTHATAVFSFLYMTMGWFLVIAVYMVLRYMTVPRLLSLAASIFFTLSPPVILYENWLFYTYPVAMLLIISALLLNRYFQHNKTITLIVFFGTLTSIVLTRTLFHSLWLAAVVLWLIIVHKERAKQILICSLLPLAVLGVFHVKNMIIFQKTGFSSWFGMNLAKMTLTVPLDRLQPDIDRGVLSPIIRLEPFRAPEEYYAFAPFDSVTMIPALDMQYKSTGYPNFNHVAYMTVSQEYFTSALHLVRKYPQYYMLSITKALYRYLQPCSDKAIFVNDNRARMETWTAFYEDYLLGNVLERVWHTTFTNRYGQTRTVHLNFLFIFFPFIMLWGTITARDQNKPRERAAQLTHIFMIGTILYVTIIGNALEMSENMRFRFLIVPFIYIFICLFFKRFFKKSQ
ncbi:hypothetical protein JXB22_00710 [candidate division WOR-3 bacterium]|nr:hypothetical protein [candidate division WOR-3 bacterium]